MTAARIASKHIPPVLCDRQVPAWPFIAASYFAGSFSLIPFFAIWNTPPHTSRAQMKVPPARSQLIGRRNTMLR